MEQTSTRVGRVWLRLLCVLFAHEWNWEGAGISECERCRAVRDLP